MQDGSHEMGSGGVEGWRSKDSGPHLVRGRLLGLQIHEGPGTPDVREGDLAQALQLDIGHWLHAHLLAGPQLT